MSQKTGLLVSLVVPLLVIPSCLRDFEKFDASGEGGGAGDFGGALGDGDAGLGGASGDGDGDLSGDGGAPGNGGTGGDGAGDGGTGGDGGGEPGSGGASGGGPNPTCSAGAKLCGQECVPDDDVATGCSESSCGPCPGASHREAVCSSGACDLGACEPGFFDCDESVNGDCEHSVSTFSEFACGGCEANCTTLGLTNCQGTCGCATDAECGDTRRNVVCSNRLCVCDDSECNPGETCGRAGNASVCECGGGDACTAGWVCCPGAAGATCRQLDGNDPSNCGACGFRCADGQVCVNGACQ
jgi:hypothetical protein